MESDWGQYMLDLDGQPGSCVVDLAWAEAGPDESLPVCTLLRIPFAEAGEGGLGGDEEVDRIRAVEDVLLETVQDELGLVMVATVRGGGAMDYWFYGATDRSEELLDAAASAFEGYEVEGGSQEDPEWKQYFDALFPDRHGMRQIGDQRVLLALMEAGDQSEVPRAIEHLAVFATKDCAEGFAAKVKEEGFRVDGVSEVSAEEGEEVDEDAKWKVEFANQSAAELGDIMPVTAHLEDLAEECGGCYDGWQTAVVKS
jgi:regulator of RNase E activity RraB